MNFTFLLYILTDKSGTAMLAYDLMCFRALLIINEKY
jgi:hypothetical protein